ncbi:hypothetical protein AXFE_01240 [Acidithrix ferrooxidans]|uniref:Uncharacterized protein n=1 Tax=Acidithrix ferrooxidans TaxID=1280514 RepID=A0A0D8HMU6_9ACTN|nr:hypothetical protein AXFE_01240 [Acidithrix ferrooxidans]
MAMRVVATFGFLLVNHRPTSKKAKCLAGLWQSDMEEQAILAGRVFLMRLVGIDSV